MSSNKEGCKMRNINTRQLVKRIAVSLFETKNIMQNSTRNKMHTAQNAKKKGFLIPQILNRFATDSSLQFMKQQEQRSYKKTSKAGVQNE